MNITPILDVLTLKNVNTYYKEYVITQWYNKGQMRQYQLLKLKKLLNHCYTNVPFYRNYIDKNKINIAEIKSIDDIVLFPIITKEIIKDNYEQFTPINLNKIKGVKISQTGGTTGNILFKRNDANTRSSVWATFKRFQNDWMGVKDNEKKIQLMGGHIKKQGLYNDFKLYISHFLNNEISFDIYNTAEEQYDNIKKSLQNNKFSWMHGYSQFIFSLAQRFQKENLHFDIKAISTTAEPLTLEHRKLFKEIFNAEIYDQYGCGEIGGVAYECNQHKGLHVAEERVILEVNDKSELIITDLDNYAMPFIRYWNADQVVLSDVSCACGRNGIIIKEIMGRTCDYIMGLNGEFLHWAYFWHLFFDSDVARKRDLRKFQVVQTKKDELLLRIVSEEFNEEEKLFFINNITQRVGLMHIAFSFEKNIEPTKTGKFRPVINKLL